ncbi:MAG: hypothetical protein ABIT09_07685 [Croceibacterium sp.]
MRRLVLIMSFFLSACGNGDASPDQSERDQQDVALVEKANNTLPPLEEIEPQPLTPADMKRYDLLGEACNYAPGTSLGTRIVARVSDAFAKIDGEVERFAADAGSRELPQHSRTLYNSKNYVLRLQIGGDGAPDPATTGGQEGLVEIRDVHGRVVYQGSGPVTCSS